MRLRRRYVGPTSLSTGLPAGQGAQSSTTDMMHPGILNGSTVHHGHGPHMAPLVCSTQRVCKGRLASLAPASPPGPFPLADGGGQSPQQGPSPTSMCILSSNHSSSSTQAFGTCS